MSETNCRRLISDHHFPARKALMMRNGVDTERVRRDRVCGESWRRRWKIPRRAVVFGAVGRFAREGLRNRTSGLSGGARAVPEKELRLVLVGEGPQEAALRAQAEEIIPRGRVVFAPFCEKPWEPLSAFDLFVNAEPQRRPLLALVEANGVRVRPGGDWARRDTGADS